jgi:hypothetical protein
VIAVSHQIGIDHDARHRGGIRFAGGPNDHAGASLLSWDDTERLGASKVCRSIVAFLSLLSRQS